MDLPFEQLLKATKVREVTDVISQIQENFDVSWRYVGDTENNLATINLGSDPAAGLIERITNAFDAVLDLEWHRRDQPAGFDSPRAAVEDWFGIPAGKLKNVTDLRSPAIAALVDRVQVILWDSERPDRPTVDIRDTGLGIAAEDFQSTILSLHKSRKLRKLFLAGAFGQGGSTALAYSQYTIIASKPATLARKNMGAEQEIGFTIVRFNSGDPSTDKHGVYEYLVNKENNEPFRISAHDSQFQSGTLVRHVSMELGKYKNIITAPTSSPWFLTHNYLFDPVLPLRLVEERANPMQGERRAVAGNMRLLTRSEHTEYQRNAVLTFRAGSVSLTWWVLTAQGEAARNRLTQYVQPSKPIIVTCNGQKQGDFPNTIVKSDLQLPYLERYLIVHVDCDRLDSESRRLLFPTTREALRDTPIGDDLRRLIIDTLSADTELQRLDRERKQKYLQQSDDRTLVHIRRRLTARLRAVQKSVRNSTLKNREIENCFPVADSQTKIEFRDPPSFLQIIGKDLRLINLGARFAIRFRTDADPARFRGSLGFTTSVEPPRAATYIGYTNLQDGFGVAYFAAGNSLQPAEMAEITLSVGEVRASTRVEMTAAVSDIPAASEEVDSSNINPQWVTELDDFWRDNDWTDQTVAKVVRSKESVEVYVSASNERFAVLIARAQRRSVEAVDAIKDFYLEHITFHALLESADADIAAADSISEEPIATRQTREMIRACETICGIAEAMFEVVVELPHQTVLALIAPEAA